MLYMSVHVFVSLCYVCLFVLMYASVCEFMLMYADTCEFAIMKGSICKFVKFMSLRSTAAGLLRLTIPILLV